MHHQISFQKGPQLVLGGTVVPLQPIGRGMFSAVYRERGGSRRVFALTHPVATEKEILAQLHEEHPDNPHLPAVERLGVLEDGRRVYQMPFYEAIDQRIAADKLYSIYEHIAAVTHPDAASDDDEDDEDAYEPPSAVLARYQSLRLSAPLKEALLAVARAAVASPRRMAFEIALRNLAFDRKGRLVLLDLLYDYDLGDELAQKWAKENNCDLGAALP